MENAIFRTLSRHPGYRFGADGSIWSSWRFRGGGYGRPGIYAMSDRWRLLRGEPRNEDGRLRYTLRCSDGKYRRDYGSTFILEAFVGPRPDGMECCHGDGNCLNNAANNLRWGTSVENKTDQKRHGTTCRGSRHPRAKITEEIVREIRRVGHPLKQHAVKYGITEAMVSLILKRKAWSHVQ